MRFIILLLITTGISFGGCSSSEDPKIPVVETLEVTGSSSSSRMFSGVFKNDDGKNKVIAYGFQWESRYGSWKAIKKGKIKGKFFIKDFTPLSKWNSFKVRAFIETTNGLIYGDVKQFITEGK
jgi:hypothetical protein